MEGGPHQFAFALFASVNVRVDSIDDSVVLGEVFGLGHIWTVGAERAGRQQTKVAKGGRCATQFRSASAAIAFSVLTSTEATADECIFSSTPATKTCHWGPRLEEKCTFAVFCEAT